MKNIEKSTNSISITWPGSKRRKCFAITASEGKEFVVDWNDGSAMEKMTGTGKPQRMCHVYGNVRNYTLSIIGTTDDCLLTSLSCSSGQITHIDASANAALRELWCSNNELTGLDVSANTELKKLDCSENKITALDVSANTKLEWLACFDNRLTSLNLNANTALWRLWCSNNGLTDLDVSANTALLYFRCYGNQLSALDVSANTVLKELWCGTNQLSVLDVSANTVLQSLACQHNQLIILNLNANAELQNLWCFDNRLTMLELNANAPLQYLKCYNNRLQLFDLYEASKMMNESSEKYLGQQTLIPQKVAAGTSVDFLVQRDINNIPTIFHVEKDGKPAFLSDYMIARGTITFHCAGNYKITLTNDALDSHQKYPAKMIAELTVVE